MTALAQLLADCATRGIRLLPVGNSGLTIDAPKGCLTPDVLRRLRAQKNEVLAALMAPSSKPVPDVSNWVLKPDARGCLGWEPPDLPEGRRWWAIQTFDDLPVLPPLTDSASEQTQRHTVLARGRKRQVDPNQSRLQF